MTLRSRFWRSFIRTIVKNRDLSLAELRSGGDLRRIPPWLVLKGVKVEKTSIAGIDAEWLVPDGFIEGKVILYLHGGGYVAGSAESYRNLTASLARSCGMKVLAPDYRLAPEQPFPAALDDSVSICRELLANTRGADGIVISGDSAGGGLALASVMKLRDEGEKLPAAIVCLSPWTDLELKGSTHRTKTKDDAVLKTDTLREWAAWYADADNRDKPLVSPINGDYRDFPPLMIQVGSEEILLSDSIAVAKKVEAAGVRVDFKIWDGMWHCWQLLGDFVPENRASFGEIRRFVRSNTGLRS